MDCNAVDATDNELAASGSTVAKCSNNKGFLVLFAIDEKPSEEFPMWFEFVFDCLFETNRAQVLV